MGLGYSDSAAGAPAAGRLSMFNIAQSRPEVLNFWQFAQARIRVCPWRRDMIHCC